MPHLSAVALVLLFGVTTARSGTAQDVWTRADSAIERLRPAAFAQLPAVVRRDLERRRCTIPQNWLDARPHNVIAGSFIRHDSKDWAVLCSQSGISRILVFRDGKVTAVDSLAPMPDRGFLQEVDSGKIGYSRKLNAVDKEYIIERARRYDGPTPPPIDHHGIEDGFLEKGSTILYFYRGTWRRLQGAN